MKAFAEELGLAFPLLFAESQQTAKDYFAACTPDIFLFDGDRGLDKNDSSNLKASDFKNSN